MTQPTSTLEGNVAIVKHIKLRELDVSRIGLGAMGMSHGYTGAGSDDAESIRTIHRALKLGVTLLDTAEIYGPYTNDDRLGGSRWGEVAEEPGGGDATIHEHVAAGDEPAVGAQHERGHGRDLVRGAAPPHRGQLSMRR